MNCRICSGSLAPLLHYSNMPKSAQFLPKTPDAGIDLDVRQCQSCGTVQLTNEPVFYHRSVIRASGLSEEMILFRRAQFSQFIDDFALHGRKVLEIGCGRGEFMQVMNVCGTSAYGIEYAPESIQACKARGLRAFQGYIESPNATAPESPYDAFYCLNFLEHMPEPNTLLTGVRNSLKDRAVGLVEVPNFDMILRNKLFSEFISDHLFYFTRDTLNTLLRLNGFDVLDTRIVWHDYIISSVVRKREKADVSGFDERLAHVRAQIESFINRYAKVAIWGAGHQALTMIAMAGLKGKIEYVVDSAKFKQGCYTPATGIPIVSPDMLGLDPVDAIIIMCAGYSDEVARTIRITSDIPIAMLREHGLEVI